MNESYVHKKETYLSLDNIFIKIFCIGIIYGSYAIGSIISYIECHHNEQNTIEKIHHSL